MEITSFQLSPDRTLLVLNLSNAATVTNLYVYTQKTYKVDAYKIDLSAKLSAQSSQTINISPADLNVSEFDGLYFVDVVSPAETKCAIAADLHRYEDCVLNEIMDTEECQECPDEVYQIALNMFMLLRGGVELAIKHNLAQEALTAIYAMDKYCDDCATCGEYKKS